MSLIDTIRDLFIGTANEPQREIDIDNNHVWTSDTIHTQVNFNNTTMPTEIDPNEGQRQGLWEQIQQDQRGEHRNPQNAREQPENIDEGGWEEAQVPDDIATPDDVNPDVTHMDYKTYDYKYKTKSNYQKDKEKLDI